MRKKTISHSYFGFPKNINFNTVISAHYFELKVPNKRELQQIGFNHLSSIDLQDFMNLYEKCTEKTYFFFISDTALASDNFLHFRKNLSERI